MRHSTVVDEVDLKFIERAKATRESGREPGVENDPATVYLESQNSPPRQAVEPHDGYGQSAYTGCETGGRVWLKYFP